MPVMSFPTRIVHGRGSLKSLPDEMKRAGAKERVFVVTDQGILKANLLRLVIPQLEHAGLKVTVWPDALPNPTEANAIAGGNAFKESGADSILGVGGGSALDVAKAVALLAHHEPPMIRYDDAKGGDQHITDQIPPMVLVPTTAGTGSEVGRSTVLLIDGTKVVIFSPYLLAKAAILDAELTVGLPPFLTAATGLDALTHNLEAFVAKGDHPLADAISVDGMQRVARWLKVAVKNGKDLEAREQMLLASSMGAIAFQKGLGAAHSMAHALTPVAGTHHGLANALVLPSVIHFNRVEAEEKIARAAYALGFDTRASVKEAASAAAELVATLRHEIGLPGKLSQAGVKHEQIPQLVEKAIADACHLSNPRTVTERDFERMLQESF